MYKIIILISGTVVIVNLIYALLPSGNYEKYSKHILGLILVLVFINSLVNVELSSEILNFDQQIPTFSQDKIRYTIEAQTATLLEDKIKQHLNDNDISVKDIKITLKDASIEQIFLISNGNIEKICEIISDFCEISTEKIVINQEVKTN